MSQQWQGPPGQPGYGPQQPYGQQPQGGPPYGQGFQQGPPPKSSNTLVVILIVLGVLVVVGGMVATLAIFGVRKYIASAKTAEAKNSISAIAREAAAAYEHEAPGTIGDNKSTHRLCASAEPVPAKVPQGTKYSPSTAPGKDFQSGDETHGWTCLRHSSPFSSYFQYDYRQGGDYKGPKRGGPDPGPDGFEASAEGDLNGDGKTSLFTIIGKLDKKTGQVEVNQQIFVSDELE